MAEKNQDFVTHKHLSGVLRDRDRYVAEQFKRVDDLIDDIRISQGKTENELKHITKNTAKSNEIMERFVNQYSEQKSLTDGRLSKLEEKSFLKKHIWTFAGMVLVAIIGSIGTFFQVFGDAIGQIFQ